MPLSSLRILLVEDDDIDSSALIRSLRRENASKFTLDRVQRLDEAIGRLPDGYDLILTDLNLPDSTGLNTFERIAEVNEDAVIVVLSGVEDLDLAIESIALGAQDYIVKQTGMSSALIRAVRFGLERSRRRAAERDRDRVNHSLEVARRIQTSIYPAESPSISGFEVFGKAYPAERNCGDYFDIVTASHNRHVVAVGDVSGHGIAAALTVMRLNACLRLLVRRGVSFHEMFVDINEAICNEPCAEHFQQFATMICVELDSDTKRVQFVSAGQRGFLLRQSGEVQHLDSTGLPLGLIVGTETWRAQELVTEPGDILFLPTDGFIETVNSESELFGEDRMVSVVQEHRAASVEEIVEASYEAVQTFRGDLPQRDDITAVAIRIC